MGTSLKRSIFPSGHLMEIAACLSVPRPKWTTLVGAEYALVPPAILRSWLPDAEMSVTTAPIALRFDLPRPTKFNSSQLLFVPWLKKTLGTDFPAIGVLPNGKGSTN